MSADTTSPSAPPGVQSQINAPATVTAVSLVTGKVSEAADVELRVTRTTGDNISELAPDKLDYIELSPIIFRIVVASMMIVCFMAGLDVTIVVTALPKIAQQFEADSIISWVIIAFLIAQTAVCPLVGRFSEIFGRRNVLMISVGVFTIGSLACAMSTSIIMLICFRALQGLGGGGIMSSVMVVMSDITPSRSRGMLMAPIGAVFAFSSIIGPLLGGALTDVSGLAVSGWSLCFYINLPVGVLAEVLFWVYLPGSLAQTDASRAMTIDVIGSILCIIAVTTLALALTWGGGTYPWNSGAVVSLLVIAAVFGAGFIVVEFVVAAYPIIPMRLFAVRNWWTAAWVAFWSAFGMMASVVYLPIWFQLVLGESPAQSGVSLIPMMIMMPISAMLTGVSTAKTGRYWVQPNLAAACMIISGWLLTTLSPSSTTAQRVGYLILAGLSFGPGVVVPTQQAQAAVAAEYRATTASSMSFFNFLGRLISTAIGQTVYNNNMAAMVFPATPEALSTAGTSIFWIAVAGGAMYLLGALCAVHIPLSQGHGQPPPTDNAEAPSPSAAAEMIKGQPANTTPAAPANDPAPAEPAVTACPTAVVAAVASVAASSAAPPVAAPSATLTASAVESATPSHAAVAT